MIENNNNPITLKDIAKKTGLSVAAVCKALHNKGDIGPETARRVQDVAREMGYFPNSAARSLRTGHADILGVLLPDNCDPYYSLLLKGIEEVSRERGYTVVFFNTKNDSSTEAAMLSTLLSLKVAGILTIPFRLENYKEITIPLILLSRYPYHKLFRQKFEYALGRDFHYIINDDYSGEYLATQHLLQRGYETIYFMGESDDETTMSGIMSLTRLAGYQKALEDYQIPYNPQRVLFGNTSIHESFRTVCEIIEKENSAFALCMNSDHCALGAISAICEKKLHVPKDVALVGYDDLDISAYLPTPLTTINQKKYTIGAKGAEWMLHLIETKETKICHQILNPILIVRSTT